MARAVTGRLNRTVFAAAVRPLAGGRLPREIELLCANYETRKDGISARLAPRYLADLRRIEQAAADDAERAVVGRERKDVEAGDYAAWTGVSKLTRDLHGSQWSLHGDRPGVLSFHADGTVEGLFRGTWTQAGDNSATVRVNAPGSEHDGQVVTLTFSTGRKSFHGQLPDGTQALSARRMDAPP